MHFINKITFYKILLCSAIITIPFISSFKGISALGVLGTQLSIYPLLLGLLLWFANVFFLKEKVYLPKKIDCVFLIGILLWIVMSGLINFENIIELNYQGIVGFNRYVIQTGAIFIYVLSAVMMFNWINKIDNSLDILQKCIYGSFVIAGAYSVIELIAFINLDTALDLLSSVDSLFRNNYQGLFFLGRLRSVTAEGSYFGMYAGMILPWLMLGWLNSLRHKFIWGLINGYCFLLVIMTYSRTAYIMFFFEILLFLYIFRKEMEKELKNLIIPGVIFFSVMLYFYIQMESRHPIEISTILLSVFDTSGKNMSNVARFGSQIAAYNIFLDNPFWGSGFGMYGFYAADYYPSEAWSSLEIQNWGSNVVGGNWPPAHGLYVRILAELGLPGLALWVSFLLLLIYRLYKKSKLIKHGKISMQSRALLVSTIACVLCGFNVDSFAVIGLWIFVAFGWGVVNNKVN